MNTTEDIEAVLNEAIDLAIWFLERNHEFLPFAVVMHPLGEIKHVEGYTGKEKPKSQEVVELLVQALRQDASRGEICCAALVSDVRLTLESSVTESIRLHIEHTTDTPMTCFLPYSWQGDSLQTGELIAEGADRMIFASNGAS